MSHHILVQLTGIIVLGILAQWTAWRVRLPSILLLLGAGLIAGPGVGWLHPDELFGDLLLPIVSLSVAIIMYEGGLNLEFRELHGISSVFARLATVGVFVSWLVGTLAAHYILGFAWSVATLLGAILVVTGPTVIGPILRHLRLRGRVGALLKWEGIIIDPVGATLAVLAFTVAQAAAFEKGMEIAFWQLGATLLIGILAGGIAAGILIIALSRFWIPDSLHNPVSLVLMFAAFTGSNLVQEESGLFAVTVMGIVLANQKWVSISHVIKFKENLTILLISCLFIVLAARLHRSDIATLGWDSMAFVLVMLLVARPLSVLASTWGSSLTWQERCFLCCMAPRGIVAAAISSVFALSLVAVGFEDAGEIVPVTFLVVFVTVLLYGLLAGPLVRRLGLAQANPQGILFVSADSWVRALAKTLRDEGCPVFLVDTVWENIRQARMAGLPCLYGSALSEITREKIDFTGLGRLLAVTSNNEANSLACLRYTEDFGRQEVYQLPFANDTAGRHEVVSQQFRGRLLFGKGLSYGALIDFGGLRPVVRKTKLTAEFDYQKFTAENGENVIPLFVLKPKNVVQVRTVTNASDPVPGDVIISLVRGT